VISNPYIMRYGELRWWLWQARMLAFLILIAILGRIGFIVNNFDYSLGSVLDVIKTFVYGFRLDASIAAYQLLIINILMFIMFAPEKFHKIFHGFIAFFILINVLIYVFDADLYSYWGFKIDKSVLKYISTPREAAASVSTLHIVILLLIIGSAFYLFWILYRSHLRLSRLRFQAKIFFPSVVLIFPLLFLVARGSLDVSGVNLSSAYFSQNPQLNHTAVNSVWNFFKSVTTSQRKTMITWDDSLTVDLQPFKFSCTEPTPLISVEKANIILVVLESFSANLFEYKVNQKIAVPNLQTIASEGYYFPNCYAAGDRSDKGLSALLTGFPAHPYGSIMKYPEKFNKISHLVSPFTQQGYSTAFYYGGNSDFANFRGLWISSGFQKIVDQDHFPSKFRTSKWGIHDDFVIQRFLNDIQREQNPFFYAVFTLSSHEPFDVPYQSDFNSPSELGKYLNSVAFTDSVIGDFYRRLKETPLWENTLLIFTADHGHYYPLKRRNEMPEHYRIPLIFTGGALNQSLKGSIDTRNISQSDIPYTLLRASGLASPNPFPFERNFLCSDYNAPVGYVFNFGYGIISPNGESYIFDYKSGKWIENHGDSSELQKAGDAWFRYLIHLYEE